MLIISENDRITVRPPCTNQPVVLGLPWLSKRTHERLREARFSAKGQIWNGCSSSSILLVCLPIPGPVPGRIYDFYKFLKHKGG